MAADECSCLLLLRFSISFFFSSPLYTHNGTALFVCVSPLPGWCLNQPRGGDFDPLFSFQGEEENQKRVVMGVAMGGE